MISIADLRGPGVRRNLEDSGDDYDMDLNQRPGFGGRSGKIILLGDGTEVLTENDDAEMFDHEEEDKDLDYQIGKGQSQPLEEGRGGREETPGPEEPTDKQSRSDAGEQNSSDTSTSPTTNNTAISERKSPTVIPESALPDKIVPQPSMSTEIK